MYWVWLVLDGFNPCPCAAFAGASHRPWVSTSSGQGGSHAEEAYLQVTDSIVPPDDITMESIPSGVQMDCAGGCGMATSVAHATLRMRRMFHICEAHHWQMTSDLNGSIGTPAKNNFKVTCSHKKQFPLCSYDVASSLDINYLGD
eukprot:6002555-Amphidinium_carterae.1